MFRSDTARAPRLRYLQSWGTVWMLVLTVRDLCSCHDRWSYPVMFPSLMPEPEGGQKFGLGHRVRTHGESKSHTFSGCCSSGTESHLMEFCPFTVSSGKVRTLQSDIGSCGRHVAYGYPELAWAIPEGSTSLNVASRNPAIPPSKSPVESPEPDASSFPSK
jgi:hypothetical protein